MTVGNLAAYQEIVIRAHELGGVENLIREIERNAVALAAPKYIAAGLGAGLLFAAAGFTAKYLWDKRKERLVQAELAKQRLRKVVGESVEADQPASNSADHE